MRISPRIAVVALALAAAVASNAAANVIDGTDDRGSLIDMGAALACRSRIDRIRKVSGCGLLPTPALGSGALFLNNRQI
jgi:hypothetical protein